MFGRGKSCKIIFKKNHLRNLLLSRKLSSVKGQIPRRSFLYIPGNEERKVSKATGLNSDCVVLDCEDGVASNKKVQWVKMKRKKLKVYKILGELNGRDDN